ncbi:NUDIX domain-containing protein [Arsenicicoccus dermatophilus]|uniref:NUDIX domain-containing protein n=1 Tax=Arsenicicoccus dermatophilus TaxID=1076331 RepID=UPI00391760B7
MTGRLRIDEIAPGVVQVVDGGADPAILRAAVETALAEGWRRVEARIPAGDPAARRAAARAGLRLEGLLRGAAPDGGDLALMARLAGDPAPDSRDGFSAVLNTTLPLKRNIAQGLVRDPAGRVLLCETTYKRDWDLPGGVVDPGEPPSRTVEREIEEELGLTLPVGDLATVAWLPPYLGWADATLFVFDTGVHDPAIVEAMVLQPQEIRAVHWAGPDEIAARTAPYVQALLTHLGAREPRSGTTYLVDGRPRRT